MVSTVFKGIISRLFGCILFSVSFHAKLISPCAGETETIYFGSGRKISPVSIEVSLWFLGCTWLPSCRLSNRYCTKSHIFSSTIASWFLGYSLLPVTHVPLYTLLRRICNSVLYVPMR